MAAMIPNQGDNSDQASFFNNLTRDQLEMIGWFDNPLDFSNLEIRCEPFDCSDICKFNEDENTN